MEPKDRGRGDRRGGGERQRIKEVKKIGKMRVMGETGPLRKLTGKTHNVFVCVGG